MTPVVQPIKLLGRSVPEWIGKTPDAKVPVIVRLRVFARYDGRCYLSGTKIGIKDEWDLEHIKALADGGEHREANMAPALKEPHRKKTSRENSARSKAHRTRAKHLGIWKGSGRKIPQRKDPWGKGRRT